MPGEALNKPESGMPLAPLPSEGNTPTAPNSPDLLIQPRSSDSPRVSVAGERPAALTMKAGSPDFTLEIDQIAHESRVCQKEHCSCGRESGIEPGVRSSTNTVMHTTEPNSYHRLLELLDGNFTAGVVVRVAVDFNAHSETPSEKGYFPAQRQ